MSIERPEIRIPIRHESRSPRADLVIHPKHSVSSLSPKPTGYLYPLSRTSLRTVLREVLGEVISAPAMGVVAHASAVIDVDTKSTRFIKQSEPRRSDLRTFGDLVRRLPLTMTLVVECRLVSERLPLTDVAAAVPDVTLRVENTLTSARSRPVLIFWADGGRLDSVDAALRDASVATHSVLGSTVDRRLYRVELSERPPAIYTEFIRLDTAPISATITPSGWDVRTRLSDRATLAEFNKDCEENGITFRLDRVVDVAPSDSNEYGLTAKQRETLLAAHEAGYFSVPRTTSLAELGAELGVTAPSVSERLRRAQDRLVRHTVASDKKTS
ncbi:helix-turn-helix domain-containing protein [Haloferax volcanii]|nr:helix-turn-helix domain-containing protein [Haloferax volcanii]